MNKIEQLEQQLASIQEELTKMKAEVEWPRVSDIYFAVATNGDIASYSWVDSLFDAKLKNFGNIFRTEEEAIAERDARKVVAELRRQPGRKKFVCNETNYCITIDFSDSTCNPNDFQLSNSGFASVYFDSRSSVQKALATVGNDRIITAARWWAMEETK